MTPSIVAAIQRAAHAIAILVDAARLGVTQAEAHVLAHLHDGDASVGAIHRECGHKRSTLTSILDRLEDRGLIERAPDPADRRSFIVRLTPGGKPVAQRVRAVFDEFEKRFFARFGAEERAMFERILAAVSPELGDA